MGSRKKCLECKERIIGRTDKKFCDDLCRSNYNNRVYRKKNNRLKLTNRILKTNYDLLNTRLTNGVLLIPRTELKEQGFRFNYLTGINKRKGRRVFNIYDIQYVNSENGNYLKILSDEEE